MKRIKRYVRIVISFALAAIFWQIGGSLLWVAFTLLGLFFMAVDVFGIEKTDHSMKSLDVDWAKETTGLLKDYTVDATPSYGLFFDLCDNRIFVDIKQDKYVEERKKKALQLLQDRTALEESLKRFFNRHPSFKTKHVRYIGLHSDDLNRAEVFWEPDGYTLLKGLEFIEE